MECSEIRAPGTHSENDEGNDEMAMGQKSQQSIITAISGRTGFVVNSMSGRRVGNMEPYSTGEMTQAERTKYLKDRPTYVIWSYGTPIAWVSADNRKVVTGHKYSGATSQHVNIIKRAFGTYETA